MTSIKNLEKPLERQVRTLKCCLLSYKSSSDQGFSCTKKYQCCHSYFTHSPLYVQPFAQLHAPTLSCPRRFTCLDLALHRQMRPERALTCRC